MSATPASDPCLAFLAGGGEMAARIRDHDWSRTPLGPPASWPQPLKTLVGLMLASQQPMFMAWGAGQIWLSNDAFIPILGRKHPHALGAPALEVWGEARESLEPLFDQVFAGKPVHMQDINLMLDRHGRLEEAHFSFSYTPVRDERGAVAGLFGACIETTQQLLAKRHQQQETERQRRMFEQAPSFICILHGPEHVYGFVNNAHRKLFNSGSWIGKPVRAAIPDLEGQGYFELLDRVYATGERYVARAAPFRYRLTPNAPEEERLLDFIYEPITDDTGRITGIFCEGYDVTETRRAELALLESEKRFHDIADAAPVLIWISDATGACSWVNKGWLALTGRTLEEELGGGWTSSLHPDDLERCLATYAQVFERRAPLRMDFRLRSRDGSWRTVDDTGVPRFASDGTFLGYIGCCIDVTDARAAEQALRRSEEQLRLATEAAEIGLWDVDTVTDTLFWPPRVKAMFGISPEVPVSMADFYAGLHPGDREATSAAFAAACDPARRALYDVEYRSVGKEDGVVRWVAAKGRGVFDSEGRCVRVIGTAIDITARKQIEARLRELNETLERRVEERTAERDRVWRNSRDLLVVIGPDGIFRAVNPAWTEILGHAPEEVVGRSYLDFVLPEDAAVSASALRTAAVVHDLTSFENRYLRKDGTPRWISWHTSVEGELVYAYGRDITTAKAQEAALAEAETALRQAQKMEAVGQLTGGIAHDFNNLLQGVAGSLDLIRRKPDDVARVRRWAEVGLRAAERGAKLTAQLLAFSRAQKLELKPLDLAALLSGMRELLGRTLGPSIRVVLDLEPASARVMGDETQLEMAVLNLAINARDAMPRGGALQITTRRRQVTQDPELAPGDYVELSVADTGEGMPPEVAARAFDPFFTTKGVGKGTGLGLSQVYGMARQAGGAARIHSAQGKGTTVRLFLRCTAGDAAEERRPEREGGLLGPRAATVLVVDDDPDVRCFLAESLDALGFAVMEAEDGQAGLAALARSAPDLMILDYAMPGLTGAEVAQKARTRRPDLPILFASGYADTAALEDVLDARTMVVRKPFGIGELQQALTKVLMRT